MADILWDFDYPLRTSVQLLNIAMGVWLLNLFFNYLLCVYVRERERERERALMCPTCIQNPEEQKRASDNPELQL